ncbi:VCBS repeat domain-containing M23 family metallopeptidase [Rhizohabitans arisaemae]|uniref:VCBS repeat domain-containing M23 family metallopeptidase n=1 Tax=Rhizohabitans arisaemae TaxID=2720610 RepID=UPI0024B2286E|nr:VCBS repeat domain-containing M23 family metallopeptidase [Rhizohabitans arisaemae]
MNRLLTTALAVVAAIAAIPVSATASASASAATLRPLFQLPFLCGENWRLSTYRGHDDYDIDFFASGGPTAGRTIVAAAGGRVLRAGWDGRWADGSNAPPGTVGTRWGLGYHVIIDHGGGWTTVYGHMVTWPAVATGQTLTQGRYLGNVGKTGATRVEHLHYEQLDDTLDPTRTRGVRDKTEAHFNGIPSGITTDGDATTGPLYIGGSPSPNQYRTSNNCGGGGSEPPLPPPGPPGTGTGHADLNGDGKTDLLAVYDGDQSMNWYPGKGDGTFWSARRIDQAHFKLMAKGDLNGDGKADLLAIYEATGGLYWYPGKGDGTFWSARYIDHANFRHMELADLNGDRILDLLAIYEGSNGMHWYPGKGDGTFWSARYIDQAGFKNVAVGDLNGDGKADLLAVYDATGGMHWYPGKGDGTFWSARYIDQAGFRHMELADLNGDGKRDLLAVYDGSNGMHWYPGKGDGTFWSARYIDQAGFKLMAL